MDRVLEIGHVAAGYCGRLFVRNGADVVRIALPDKPAWASKTALELYLHAGKRCLIEGDNSLTGLANQADVVICETGTADELLAMGFDDWQAPVKVAVTPFGRTGPKKNWQATPNVILAMGGYTYLMGEPDKAPLTLPGHYLEFQTGALAYAAANACCLAQQHKTIDLGMLETLASLSQFTTVRWHCAGEIRSRHGSDFWFVVPTNLFACLDGWVYINIAPAFWDAFTIFLHKPELLIDKRFETNDAHMVHREELHAEIAEVLTSLSKREVVRRAEVARIPLGIVQTFDDVLADFHLAQRQFWEQLQNNLGPQLQSPGLAYRINGEPRQTYPPQQTIAGGLPW